MWSESSRTVTQDPRAGCRVALWQAVSVDCIWGAAHLDLEPLSPASRIDFAIPAVAQKVVALRKKQQLAIGPCKSLPNSPSHSAVSAASIPAVHINQVRPLPGSRLPVSRPLPHAHLGLALPVPACLWLKACCLRGWLRSGLLHVLMLLVLFLFPSLHRLPSSLL